jgi:uroporphyrin-III C-methyltransferase
MNKPIMKGKVYLMGAGPGDPDLLTVQAVRILRSAEVVLHDHLVAGAILDLIPAWTQVRNVGKRCGSAGISQEQIHSLLISAAREGHQVVRLKGGDPLLFGRVGEEMEALSRAGIEFEVVPGVTSAMGAAAAAKIPLTDRRFASKLVFMSNHSAGQANTNWEDVTSQDATHVVYMPGPNYAEIGAKLSAGGLDGRTPCLIVTHATQPEQQIRRTTLRELALERSLPAPALLIIGEVARALPPLQDDEKTSSRKASEPHEEILHLTDAPAKSEIIV